MSGIAGVVFTGGREMTAPFLAHVAGSATPRGFDGISQWYSGPAGMIRFHHATTPEAVGEVQPLAGPSGAVIAFDGRLDNRGDLLALLGERGAALVDAPDAGLALALFEARGEGFLKVLVGDWALAIWQPDRQRLFAARSPMGWRPLMWHFDGKIFGFATEPRALVAGLGIARRVNEGVAGEFMSARFVTDTETFWTGIERIEQGGGITLENGRVSIWHWHDGPFEDLSHLSDEEHVERFLELFDQALIATTRSSTPVAAHLSGGLDSSSIVARITELQRAGRIACPLVPVSARFPGELQDETVYSAAVEAHSGIEARITKREPQSIDEMALWCAETLQLPMRPSATEGFLAGIGTQQAMGERVLLTGEGGDDWMAGTFGHLPDMLLRGNLTGLYREAMSQFPQEPPFVRLRRGGFLALAPVVSPAYRNKFLRPHLTFDDPIPGWIRPEWAAKTGLADRWAQSRPPVDPPGFAQKQRYGVFVHARRHTAHEPLLAFTERHGVELRHPFHDLRLANFFMGASGRMLKRGGERKYLLRQAMRGTLPELVRTRQDKAIFITSLIDMVEEYFRRRPPEQLLPAKLGWIDGAKVGEMFAPALAWRQGGSQEMLNRSRLGPVWFIVAMDLWLEHAFGL